MPESIVRDKAVYIMTGWLTLDDPNSGMKKVMHYAEHDHGYTFYFSVDGQKMELSREEGKPIAQSMDDIETEKVKRFMRGVEDDKLEDD